MSLRNRIISVFLAVLLSTSMLPLTRVGSAAVFSGALQFDSNGKFTVMQIADIQDNGDVDNRVIALLTNAIARYSPDLCVFTGDNTTGSILTTTFKNSVNEFLAPLLNTNTKFAVTFGNHDAEGIAPSKTTQYDYFMSRGGSCAVDHDVDALDGVGSGVIPIYPYGQTSGTPAFQIYPMDSGDSASSGYDCCYTSQIDYYIQRSIQYPNVPSLWFMHIPVPDIYWETMTQVPSGTANSHTGNGSPFSSYSWILNPSKIDWSKSGGTTAAQIYKEPPCPPNQSTYEQAQHRSSASYGSKTLYEAWSAYGNLLGAYFGHDHKNSFVTTTDEGIDLGYGKAPTLNSYNDGNPGVRIFELDINGTYTSQSVTEADLNNPAGDYTAVNNAIANARVMAGSTPYYRASDVNDPGYYKASGATVGDGFYPTEYYTDNAAALAAAINAVVYGLYSNQQSTINGYAAAINAAWQALNLKPADYTAVNQKIDSCTDGTNILAPPFYSATHQGLWLPRAYYTDTTLSSWDNTVNSVIPNRKLPDQPAVNAYVPALNVAYDALRLKSDISYTVRYKHGSVTLADEKTVGNQTAGSVVTESFLPVQGYTYVPDAGDVNGTKSLTLALTGNIMTFNYIPSSGISYKVEHYLQNIALSGYDLIETQNKTGDTGSTVTAEQKSYTGFSFNSGIPGTAVSGTVAADGSLVLKLYYARNIYSYTFHSNGGTGGTSGSLPYGAGLSAPVVERLGYHFVGWSPSVPATMPAGHLIFTAQWSPVQYTITFDANGGEGGTVTRMAYGTPLTAPAVYREGYTYSGWLPMVPSLSPAADATYTAQWTPNNYIITFDANGGTGGGVFLLTYDTVLTAPAVEREGYVFAGWTPALPSTVPSMNTVYTAVWEKAGVSLEIAENSATVINRESHLIYGLAPGMSVSEFENAFVRISGDGRLEYSPTGSFGTGTEVSLIDNVTGETVESYTIVIYGDVNGDGAINALDADVVAAVQNWAVEWDPVSQACFYQAGDVNGDGVISGVDADIINGYANWIVDINQVTGLPF